MPGLRAQLPGGVTLQRGDDMALIALQGPKAEAVLAQLAPGRARLSFMHYAARFDSTASSAMSRAPAIPARTALKFRSSDKDAVRLWQLLLADPEVKPIGLGARDSLRLEAGLCLYGHDIDETTSPVEADLVWSIGKRRRSEGGFIGAERVLQRNRIRRRSASASASSPKAARRPAKAPSSPMRAAAQIGVITSGGFGPTANGPDRHGLCRNRLRSARHAVQLIVRDKPLPAAGREPALRSPSLQTLRRLRR